MAVDQLLDVVEGQDHAEPCRWLAARDSEWLATIAWVTLDLSGLYRTVFDTMLPDAVQIADPFHVCHLQAAPGRSAHRAPGHFRTLR